MDISVLGVLVVLAIVVALLFGKLKQGKSSDKKDKILIVGDNNCGKTNLLYYVD